MEFFYHKLFVAVGCPAPWKAESLASNSVQENQQTWHCGLGTMVCPTAGMPDCADAAEGVLPEEQTWTRREPFAPTSQAQTINGIRLS